MYSTHAARAYQQTSRAVVTGRELEALLLLKSAAQLQAVRDSWETRRPDLLKALTYNRKLWIVLIDLILKPDNPLDDEIKNNLFNLSLFIFRHTLEIECDPAPEKLGALIDVNRAIAEGLRA
ncbi:flagellar biosynthesis regulatory protein FlaF [Siculibacillus lacustris]|uniref:Flagellar biosynthesis regulatory protein FlaF n=1 Tax=Siculibacillus lacustris TaxID=1549641 RepID=A0A4Q9VF52_9HYPH|nr:flagellar biosynthesis regulator FlaF [Siculibacillus lacustris]TBW33500.1 flagellar biosynthesis regulatory protein FlaF [Siculibacillus lacustris]